MSRHGNRKLRSLLYAGAASFALCMSASAVRAEAASTDATAQIVPILFDDTTVHAHPVILKKDRALAALVRGHEIFVPLRSMFERMGATVSASADGRTIDASKNGSSVSVTVGVSKVVINGETRPLDVPPMMYRGIVLVPVRVMSEALGAYVQWVPDRRIVVVRYFAITATAAPVVPAAVLPTPAPSVPAAAPIPAATAAAVLAPPYDYRAFVQGAFAEPKNYNEFSAGKYCPESYTLTAAYVFKNSNFAIKGDFREDAYVSSDDVQAFGNHYTRFATIDGGVALAPVFLARQSSLDGRLEYKVASPRIYVGVGFIHDTTNYGYPNLSGVGAGVEKLSSLRPGIDLSGSAFYYPSVGGNYTVADATSPNFDKTYSQQFAIVKYHVGIDLVLAHSPVYIDGGFEGERYSVHRDAPIGQSHDGPYLGLGVKI